MENQHLTGIRQTSSRIAKISCHFTAYSLLTKFKLKPLTFVKHELFIVGKVFRVALKTQRM
jgi:hypothetical protein